jgi:hypothetical protein
MEMIRMQHEHCTFCGFMGLTKMPVDGMKKCGRCNWEGYPERSSMEEINKLAKGYRPGTKWAPPIKADALKMQVEGLDEIEGAGTPEYESDEQAEEPKQQSLAPNPRLSPVQNAPTPNSTPSPQRSSGIRMSDSEAFSSENRIDPNRKVSNKVPGNQELLDRLKGKNIKGADFL